MGEKKDRTHKLLKDHKPDTNPNTLLHILGKHRLPRSQKATVGLEFGFDLLVKHDGGLDLEELGTEDGVVGGQTTELGQGGDTLLVAVLHGEPTRGEGEEEHADEQDPGEEHLEGQGEPPGDILLARTQVTRGGLVVEGAVAGVPVALGDVVGLALGPTDEVEAVVDPEGDGGTQGDGQLLQGDETTAQLGGCDLGLVEGDHHGEHTDADTTDDPTGKQHLGVLGRALQAGAKGEDDDGDVHGVFAGDAVGEVPTEQGTEPGTELEGGHQPALDGVAHQVGELGLKVLHDEDRGHGALVVAVHDTTQGRKGTRGEDIWVLQHTDETMLLVLRSPADGRLASNCTHTHCC